MHAMKSQGGGKMISIQLLLCNTMPSSAVFGDHDGSCQGMGLPGGVTC